MNHPFGENSQWIWREQLPDLNESEMHYFRKEFSVQDGNASLYIRVSADTRYKLYINEQLVLRGPCKSKGQFYFYEELDVSPYLRKGKNVFAAEVVHLPLHKYHWFNSIIRRHTGGFMLDGMLIEKGAQTDLSTNASWKTFFEKGFFYGEPVHTIYAFTNQNQDGELYTPDFYKVNFDDSAWGNAAVLFDSVLSPTAKSTWGECYGYELAPRPIPQLTYDEKSFVNVSKTNMDKAAIDAFIKGGGPITVAPDSDVFFELDAGELVTAYPRLLIDAEAGSLIEITCSECYEMFDGTHYKKGVRDDASGVLRGETDSVKTAKAFTVYEPFWFSTFRFLRVRVKSGASPVTLSALTYFDCTYPVSFEGTFESSGKDHKALWDVSINTLQRCMHETYEDCPFYEQLQYAFDTRLQVLFNYNLSQDARLSKKFLEDFRSSLMACGLLEARTPSSKRQIIPAFSLWWVFAVWDYILYTGDTEYAKKCRPAIDAILGWYDEKVDERGLAGKMPYWPFVDWVDSWEGTSVPNSNKVGPTTLYSILYAMTLKVASNIMEATGRTGLSAEYLSKAASLEEAVKKHCWDEEKQLFLDGPNFFEYSQHTQVLAVLCGITTGQAAQDLMLRTMELPIPQLSYSFTFYLFRAFEETGLYHLTDKCFDLWRELLDLNMTTWVEETVFQRSDCHAWGALPLYEFPSVILGVKPLAVGYSKIGITPFVDGSLSFAKGKVMTPHGAVVVDWVLEAGTFKITIEAPIGIDCVLTLPGGQVVSFNGGKHFATCAM